VRLGVAAADVSVVGEEGGGLKDYQAGRVARPDFSSSFQERTALAGAARREADFRERQVDLAGGMVTLRRRPSVGERTPRGPKAERGAVNTDARRASVDATEIPRLMRDRPFIIPRVPARR
jgi:hypothetical protein